VGQYAMLDAREWATNGWAVTLVGLTSGESNCQPAEPIGEGSLEVIRVHRRTYQKQKFASRLVWTILANVMLLGAAFSAMRLPDGRLMMNVHRNLRQMAVRCSTPSQQGNAVKLIYRGTSVVVIRNNIFRSAFRRNTRHHIS
jgi:hypothetical protein